MKTLKIILMSGLPGSGKSTIAESIARELKLPIFSVDPIESSIIRSSIKKSFETGLAAYVVADTLTAEQLKLGTSVIIDAVNAIKEARDMWQKLSAKYDAKLIIIECILDTKTHKERIEGRVRGMHGIPEVTWADVENRKKEYLPWEEERLVLDTSQTNEENLQKALDYIKEL